MKKLCGFMIQPVQFTPWLSPLALMYRVKRLHGCQKNHYEKIETTHEKVELFIKKVNLKIDNPQTLTLKFTGHSDHSCNYPILDNIERDTIYCDPPMNANCTSSDELFSFYKLQIDHIVKNYNPKELILQGHSLGAHIALRSAQYVIEAYHLNTNIKKVDAVCGFSSLSETIDTGIFYYINRLLTSIFILLTAHFFLTAPVFFISCFTLTLIALLKPEYFPRIPLLKILDAWEMDSMACIEFLETKGVNIYIHQVENDEIIPESAQLIKKIEAIKQKDSQAMPHVRCNGIYSSNGNPINHLEWPKKLGHPIISPFTF